MQWSIVIPLPMLVFIQICLLLIHSGKETIITEVVETNDQRLNELADMIHYPKISIIISNEKEQVPILIIMLQYYPSIF
jgi:hypothetical protein